MIVKKLERFQNQITNIGIFRILLQQNWDHFHYAEDFSINVISIGNDKKIITNEKKNFS